VVLRKLREYNPRKKTRALIDIILKLVQKYDIPLTVRQIHYLLVETPQARHPNTQAAYNRVSRVVTDMRYGGLLDWDKIVDETRTVYKQSSYKDINQAITSFLERYRRDRWRGSDRYLEVWVEKRTLVNLFYSITNEYDVHLASGAGFSSATYIHEAASRLAPCHQARKKILVLYFGDLDPSGDFMSEDLETRFAEWGIDLSIERICLNEKHLDQYMLPKRFDVPARKGGRVYNKIREDPRARRFFDKYGELFQVELEALDPVILTGLLRDSISKYVDAKRHREAIRKEKREIEEMRGRLGLY
jgi:hypothetical protein